MAVGSPDRLRVLANRHRLRVLASGSPPRAATGTLFAGGWIVCVAVRSGDPRWPPLVLCNGIGARLELLQHGSLLKPAAVGAARETAGPGRAGAGPAAPCNRRRAPRPD